jgi:galactonate dehydratase
VKITEFKTSIMHGVRRNWLFLKVLTDEGVYGWGEGTLEGHEKAVEQGIHHLFPRAQGQDPTRIEHIWQMMYRHGFWRGGVVMGSAMSAIDMALWDITGKVYGQPVYKLLGGAVRDRVRAYTHAEDLRGSKELVDQGFTAFKTGGWITTGSHWREQDEPEALHEKIKALRQGVGPDVDIMIDNHGRNRPSQAIRKMKAVEEFKLLFFEEPVPPENLDEFAVVRNGGYTGDIATGERLYFRWGFRDLLHRGLVDVIQPDIAHCGGISEIRRIASMAEIEHVKLAPHNPNGPIACAASVHVAAASPNFLILETARDMPWHDKVQKPPLKIKDGYFELPSKPGLGVDLDEAVIASRPYEVLGRGNSWSAEDNAVADV